MMDTSSGRVVLVTGGSKGWGRGIAQVLSKSGDSVWITGRAKDAVEATSHELGVRGIVADATQGRDWDSVVSRIINDEGRLDVLVNNAGSGIRIAPIEEQTDMEIVESISTNLTSMLLGCARVSRVMRRQRSGMIVNISSGCARHAWPGWSVYSAAKAGMVQAAKCIYAELRTVGVRVSTVIPYWGATDFAASAGLSGHPVGDPSVRPACIQPDDMGRLVSGIVNTPAHLEIIDVTVVPTIQEINPL